MKKAFPILACTALLVSFLVGCSPSFNSSMDIKRFPFGAVEPVKISDEEKAEIVAILNSGIWINSVYDCIHNRALDIDGKIIKFSTHCGHFESDGKTLTVKGDELEAAKRIFGENFGADTTPYTDNTYTKDSVETAIEEKFGISNFKLKAIRVGTIDSPEHESSRMAISGTAGENNEKWSNVFEISYSQFERLYSSDHPYVVYDEEKGVSGGNFDLVCHIINRYEE